MNPDEYVDRLIERRERGERLPVITDEVAASLAAAEVLTQLREIAVPPEFAGYLELYLRARARSFGQQTSNAIPVVRPVSRAGLRRSWTAVLGFATVLLAACISILTASARSLPGDTLYGLKQAEYQFTLNFASGPQDRASAQINQLRNALVDLRAVVTAGRDDDAIRLALSSVAAKTHDSRGAVAALPAGAERAAAELELDGVLAQEEQTVRRMLEQVDWPVRLACTEQLGALGDAVPTVTQVMVHAQSNGTLLITLTGTHFAPHAELTSSSTTCTEHTGRYPPDSSGCVGEGCEGFFPVFPLMKGVIFRIQKTWRNPSHPSPVFCSKSSPLASDGRSRVIW